MDYTSLIKKFPMAVLFIGIGYAVGYHNGFKAETAELFRFQAEAQTKYHALEIKQKEVDTKIVTEYVDKINTVTKWRTNNVEITKVVPDTSFLSNGWVYVHDSSVRGNDANSTEAANDSSSGIKANEALAIVTDNYGICEENAVRLSSLQEWILEQQKQIQESNKK